MRDVTVRIYSLYLTKLSICFSKITGIIVVSRLRDFKCIIITLNLFVTFNCKISRHYGLKLLGLGLIRRRLGFEI